MQLTTHQRAPAPLGSGNVKSVGQPWAFLLSVFHFYDLFIFDGLIGGLQTMSMTDAQMRDDEKKIKIHMDFFSRQNLNQIIIISFCRGATALYVDYKPHTGFAFKHSKKTMFWRAPSNYARLKQNNWILCSRRRQQRLDCIIVVVRERRGCTT